MTDKQARTLGELVRTAREVSGITTSHLAEALQVSVGWIVGLEQGKYRAPSPDRMARLAEILHIDAARIDRITKGSVSRGLPEMAAYFRAKYNLTDEQIARVEHYVERFTEKKD